MFKIYGQRNKHMILGCNLPTAAVPCFFYCQTFIVSSNLFILFLSITTDGIKILTMVMQHSGLIAVSISKLLYKSVICYNLIENIKGYYRY